MELLFTMLARDELELVGRNTQEYENLFEVTNVHCAACVTFNSPALLEL